MWWTGLCDCLLSVAHTGLGLGVQGFQGIRFRVEGVSPVGLRVRFAGTCARRQRYHYTSLVPQGTCFMILSGSISFNKNRDLAGYSRAPTDRALTSRGGAGVRGML